ncbi:regulator of G-protein signaling 3-like [Ruditapes philippinarum]|uniref:regulator of G-protein signaling 3-like n=1 Tax=Ruditapes philippinarum TaxID=129788 RepID=UPI00295A7B39|nr:regulator of G-protein signaling 3-like [Ruditapes philippinarum]
MARYRGRTRPFSVPTTPAKHTTDKEDSGIHLDEPGSPVQISPARSPVLTAPYKASSGSRSTKSPLNYSTRSPRSGGDVVSMRHGVTVTKARHNDVDDDNILMVKKPSVKYSMASPVSQRSLTAVTKQTEGLKLNEPCDLTKKQEEYYIPKFSKNSRGGNRPRQSLPITVRLSVDEDEGLDVGDSHSDLYTADSHDDGEEGLIVIFMLYFQGIHLDEPGSPVQISPARSPVLTAPYKASSGSRSTKSPLNYSTRSPRSGGDVVSMRHGVTVTKARHNDVDDDNILMVKKPSVKYSMASPVSQRSLTAVTKQTEGLKLNEPCDLTKKQEEYYIPKFSKNSRGGNRPRQSLPITVRLSVDEDEGLDVGDSHPDLYTADSHDDGEEGNHNKPKTNKHMEVDKDLLRVETEESSVEDSDTDNVEFTLSSEAEGPSTEQIKLSKEKSSKKKRKLKSLLPALKRSQSLGCDTNKVNEESGIQKHDDEEHQIREKSHEEKDIRRMIHKTCSADAAMMANEVLPIDPQEFMRNKQKSSIASNMRKKFQKLKRRNTDSLLGAAILSVRGTTKISHSSAVEWATSFEALLSDKNGIEMFRHFLKSEFSEENIEFWVACEEFKTVRTNKLVSRAQKIYSDFIAIKAPKQVNLDSKTRLETVTNLENPTRDMFREAQKRIQFLMENDSYKRFIDSDAYKHLIRRNSSSGGR